MTVEHNCRPVGCIGIHGEGATCPIHSDGSIPLVAFVCACGQSWTPSFDGRGWRKVEDVDG